MPSRGFHNLSFGMIFVGDTLLWNSPQSLFSNFFQSNSLFLLYTECPQPLGMENGQILDSQITASSKFDSNHGASNGRLNFAAGAGRTGSWSARINDVNQWLQVDLLGKPKVTAIMTQGRGDCSCNQFVKSFTISYSDSGSTFTSYPEGSQAKVRSKFQ